MSDGKAFARVLQWLLPRLKRGDNYLVALSAFLVTVVANFNTA